VSDGIRKHFLGQADSCEGLGSSFTAMLCRVAADLLDRDTVVGRAILDWPGLARDDAVALRFCGALHAVVLDKADSDLVAIYPPHSGSDADLPRVMAGVLARHETRLLEAMKSAPQTNEVARAAMLLPGFLAIARETQLPLSLFEIGASAGLNLNVERFRYTYGAEAWGDPGATVRLAPEVRAAPPLEGTLTIAGRRGCDISPVDLADPAARLRLRSYVWPDQSARVERINAAIALALREHVTVEKAGALEFIRDHVTKALPGVARTVFHSIMW